jgi:hypothetical protein
MIVEPTRMLTGLVSVVTVVERAVLLKSSTSDGNVMALPLTAAEDDERAVELLRE